MARSPAKSAKKQVSPPKARVKAAAVASVRARTSPCVDVSNVNVPSRALGTGVPLPGTANLVPIPITAPPLISQLALDFEAEAALNEIPDNSTNIGNAPCLQDSIPPHTIPEVPSPAIPLNVDDVIPPTEEPIDEPEIQDAGMNVLASAANRSAPSESVINANKNTSSNKHDLPVRCLINIGNIDLSLIQFVINWIFWDDNSPLTQQFHVVPMVVASVVTQWLQGNSEPSVVGKILDQYCRRHWRSLDSFMIFYVQNIGNYHWVLDIAVNPYCMLPMITSETTKGFKTIYGFMRMDPLEDKFQDR
jgi:hypothetical protein